MPCSQGGKADKGEAGAQARLEMDACCTPAERARQMYAQAYDELMKIIYLHAERRRSWLKRCILRLFAAASTPDTWSLTDCCVNFRWRMGYQGAPLPSYWLSVLRDCR